jgi:hypothetical protein
VSAFDDFNTQSMGDAEEAIGGIAVTITLPSGSTVSGSPKAIVDQFTAERELEMGGYVGTYDARAMVRLTYLSGVTAPIERTLEGGTLTVDGRTFRIDVVELDSVTATLGLNNPKKHSK